MNSWIKTGLIGGFVTAICCFTPIFVVLFTAIGLGALLPFLDIVLLPLLGVFIVILLWGITQQSTPKR